MSGDVAMREVGKGLPVFEFETTAFTKPENPLAESTVAIVTSAALHRQDQEGFGPADTGMSTGYAPNDPGQESFFGPPREVAPKETMMRLHTMPYSPLR